MDAEKHFKVATAQNQHLAKEKLTGEVQKLNRTINSKATSRANKKKTAKKKTPPTTTKKKTPPTKKKTPPTPQAPAAAKRPSPANQEEDSSDSSTTLAVPASNGPFKTAEESSQSGDSSTEEEEATVTAIVGHERRKATKSKKFVWYLKVKWDDGSVSTDAMQVLFEDFPDLVEDYCLLHRGKTKTMFVELQTYPGGKVDPERAASVPPLGADNNTNLEDPDPIIPPIPAEAAEADNNTNPVEAEDHEPSITQNPDEADNNTNLEEAENLEPSAPNEGDDNECNHDNYELGVSYNEEYCAACCKEGYNMCGVTCAICKALFVHTGTTVEGVTIKATFTKPVYCCVSRERAGCKHALCCFCWISKYAAFIQQGED